MGLLTDVSIDQISQLKGGEASRLGKAEVLMLAFAAKVGVKLVAVKSKAEIGRGGYDSCSSENARSTSNITAILNLRILNLRIDEPLGQIPFAAGGSRSLRTTTLNVFVETSPAHTSPCSITARNLVLEQRFGQSSNHR